MPGTPTTVADTKKVMFEIYRDPDLGGLYRVVYFTELGEHEKEEEIGCAMRGEHVYDGFILHRHRQEAKLVISSLIARLNEGLAAASIDFADELRPYMA
ncbi:MAG TPA: hypothetical protein VEB03_01985 [Candidatus Nanoarchaeia archaeon]|nr:hypothetical protein [Candidatus Nanoarchaeia archaeon]